MTEVVLVLGDFKIVHLWDYHGANSRPGRQGKLWRERREVSSALQYNNMHGAKIRDSIV
jgi:hypothetical protein